MYFETFILTILFKNAKLNIKNKKQNKTKQKTNKQTKKQPKFSKILGRSEKAKQTSFFFFFRPKKIQIISKDLHMPATVVMVTFGEQSK